MTATRTGLGPIVLDRPLAHLALPVSAFSHIATLAARRHVTYRDLLRAFAHLDWTVVREGPLLKCWCPQAVAGMCPDDLLNAFQYGVSRASA